MNNYFNEMTQSRQAAEDIFNSATREKDSDTLAGMDFTNYMENRDSLGWDPNTRRWYEPGVKGADPNNRGMGVDINTNSSIMDGSIKLRTDENGRTYLTEDDERKARERSYDEASRSARARVRYAQAFTHHDTKPSGFKMDLLRDLIYNAGAGYVAKEVFNDTKNPGFMKIFMDGSDSDAYEAITNIQRKRRRGPRADLMDSIVQFDEKKNGKFKKK